MQKSWADTIWSKINQGRYYSVRDVVNLTGESTSTVFEVMNFLAKYGFIDQVGKNEPIYKRSQIPFSPGESIDLLKTLVKTPVAKRAN